MSAQQQQQRQQSLWSGCRLRSIGFVSPPALSASVLVTSSAPFQLSGSHRLTSLHAASISSLAVDAVEWRYLLSADSHGKLALYDTQPTLVRPPAELSRADGSSGADGSIDRTVAEPAVVSCGPTHGWYVSHPLSSSTVSVRRPAGGGVGGSSINSVAWYPVDTGMFVSGGQDGGVNVWDTNAFTIEATFTMRDAAVNSVAMSPLAAASSHSLIAVASTDLNVRLCDVSSGGFAHTLIGHQAEVTTVCWTPFSEFILATASVDRVSAASHPSHRHQYSKTRLGERLLHPRSCSSSTLSSAYVVCVRLAQTVRLWDIRRSGCLLLFDQFNTVSSAPGPLSSSSSSLSARYTAAPTPSSSRRDVTSHSASVSHVAFSPSSCLLLSLGTDSRLRVWDPFSGRHLLVHFPHLQCRYRYSRFDVQQSAGVGQLGERVWLGSGRDVRAVPVSGGSGVRYVAHFDRVNVVAVNSRWDEVYSAGVDHSILVWQRQPSTDEAQQEEGELQHRTTQQQHGGGSAERDSRSAAAVDADDWSLEEGEDGI